MVAPSHILFSSTVYLAGSALAGHSILIIEFACCVVFSIFPADLDKNYYVRHSIAISASIFQTKLSDFIGDRRYYLTGQLRHAQDNLDVGKLKKFKLARLGDIPNLGYFSQIDLTLQLRIPTSAEFPKFLQTLLPQDKEEASIDPLLDKWIPDF